MLRLACDENFNNAVVRNILNRLPGLDITRIQDTEAAGKPDEVVLEWAANEGRVLLTHDLRTIPPLFYTRLNNGQKVSGVFAILLNAPSDQIATDLALLASASLDDEWDSQVLYLPL